MVINPNPEPAPDAPPSWSSAFCVACLGLGAGYLLGVFSTLVQIDRPSAVTPEIVATITDSANTCAALGRQCLTISKAVITLCKPPGATE